MGGTIEKSISRVERDVVPRRARAAEPVERVVALERDRVGLGVLRGVERWR